MNHETQFSFLSECTSGGCGAKIEPDALSGLLTSLPTINDTNLLVGFESSDDAAVYRLSEEQAIVTTVDFFSPMVQDPFLFGKIAAANALSDVYAMGATPITALNVVCFLQNQPVEVLKQILQGGALKVQEAGCALVGGHSIYDKEVKYGLSVTGVVHPNKILKNNTPEAGDKLILTKPLGVGIIMAANRVDLASFEATEKATDSMQRLNKYAAEKFKKFNVTACTDITGFGFLSHALEMANKEVSLKIECREIPYFDEAYLYAQDFLLTAAGQRNRNHFGKYCSVDHLPFALQELLFDPQTSGGLLIAVKEDDAQELLKEIQKDDPLAKIVGTAEKRNSNAIELIW